MGKDRPGRVRCAESAETLGTWYRPREGSSAAAYQQQVEEHAAQIRSMEEQLRTQQEQITQHRDQVSEVVQIHEQASEVA